MKTKKVTNKDTDNYWVCIIGPVKRKELPDGADCWSGWGMSKEKFDKIMEIWNKD